jgi:predicted alpha/beta-hydrolase family hydrolase
LQTPTLIAQGTRDPFGTRKEVSTYQLSKAIENLWLEDGDHDLKPRKGLCGFCAAGHLSALAEAVSGWARRIADGGAGRKSD